MKGDVNARTFAPKLHHHNMKGITYSQYGAPEVLQVKTLEMPSPKDFEVLVKIHATAVTIADCRLRKADPFAVRFFFGLFGPKKQVPGDSLSGEIVAVGKQVSRFKVGDQVFGTTGLDFGAYAEYKCLPENGILALKPQQLSHNEAAAIPFGGATALHFLGKAAIQPGQKVLIIGASGAVGSAAVQLARQMGAIVTGVCSGANVEMVKNLGATRVIDYTREDFSKSGETYDVVYETVGKTPFKACINVVKDGGQLILGSAMLGDTLRGAWVSLTGKKRVLAGVATPTQDQIHFLKAAVESGHYRAVLDRVYPMEAVVEAHRYVDQGHKKGNVALAIA